MKRLKRITVKEKGGCSCSFSSRELGRERRGSIRFSSIYNRRTTGQAQMGRRDDGVVAFPAFAHTHKTSKKEESERAEAAVVSRAFVRDLQGGYRKILSLVSPFASRVNDVDMGTIQMRSILSSFSLKMPKTILFKK